jgi:hypothetical protein
MTAGFRVQVRKMIEPKGGDDPEAYVFRDIELQFAPTAGLTVDDFDGERLELTKIIWSEAQHRFLAYTEPVVAGWRSEPIETIIRRYESRGWCRNRRVGERSAAEPAVGTGLLH